MLQQALYPLISPSLFVVPAFAMEGLGPLHPARLICRFSLY